MRGISSPLIGDQWPVHGWGVQAGQYRTAPPACLMARSRWRVPSQMRTKVKPIPACQMTAISRAPCPRRAGRAGRGDPRPADVVSRVPVRLVEVEHVDDPELAGHGWVLQSTTQATGHAVPHLGAGEGDLGDAVAGLDLGFGDVVGPAVRADVGVEHDPEAHRGSPLRGVQPRISRARSAALRRVGGDPGLSAALVTGHAP